MKITLIRILLVLLFVLNASVLVLATEYFVDDCKGNDQNEGTGIQQAWRTLENINSITFKPGDKILLKRNGEYSGQLHLKGSGNADSTITLGAYGTGGRPIIYGWTNPYAIQLLDAGHWRIQDIETSGGMLAGIFIGCTKDSLVLENLRIINCYVHDIGDTSKPDWDYSTTTGGIIVVNASVNPSGKPDFYSTRFNNVIIENCKVQYNYRWTCISISSGKIGGQSGDANHIRNCTVAYSCADGIRMNGVSNSFIEYCVLYRNGAWPNLSGRNLGGLGAWFFDAVNCTIQYCEAGWVGATTTDGGAFDIDYWQKNSTVQYCYGHHCAGYGVSVFGADLSYPTENSLVRYNIFSSNGRDSSFAFQGDFFVFTWNGGLLNGVNIHDNISYWDPVVPAPSLKFDAKFTGDNPNTFNRNTIISNQALLVACKNDSLQCDSNIYIKGQGTRDEGQATPVCSNSNSNWIEGQGTRDEGQADPQYSKSNSNWFEVPGWYRADLDGIPVRTRKKSSFLKEGDHINNFPAEEIAGKKIFTGDSAGGLILVSFTGAYDLLKSEKYDANAVQRNFLDGMLRQYGHLGLQLLMINEVEAIGSSRNEETWLNYVWDHQSNKITWINDDSKGTLAGKFGVTHVPATFLINSDGKILESWDQLALPAETAFAVEKHLTLPLKRDRL